MEKYVFRFREDLPSGFIENHQIPELPAAYQFLEKCVGTTFGSVKEFQKQLDGFFGYLKKQNVPFGDREIREEGISVFQNGIVGVYNSRGGRCDFGILEKKAA
ncbi:hypothetical protein HY448_01130 [Candidatus Pacearchaeota archaeon]|nr:hypothetical protein [Candidatus Pacearchaeota archaeon]